MDGESMKIHYVKLPSGAPYYMPKDKEEAKREGLDGMYGLIGFSMVKERLVDLPDEIISRFAESGIFMDIERVQK